MAAARQATALSSPEKAPRQIKSKHKSRSGCQACKLRRLKCDETKPSCRNCQKKGQECPGYTLRLQWSTKYEHPPRERVRAEPTNFGELVSAVTQTIVPGTRTQPRAAVKSPPYLKSENSSAGESTATAGTADVTSVHSPSPSMPIKQSRSPQMMPRAVTSAPGTAYSFTPTQFNPAALNLLAHATNPDYASSVGLSNTSGFAEYDTNSILGGTSVSGDSIWENTRNNSPAPGNLENLVALATARDVDEPEASVSSTGAHIMRPSQSIARLGQIVTIPQPSRPLVDIPSFLIQHWFKDVCASWSAFDSQTNPYRQLGASLWHSSMAVFYALQSMAAASLVEHLPHLKEVSRSAPRLAAQAITYELQTFRAAAKSGNVTFPTGLVLSLFCMSSSICWTDSRQFGLQFLKPGRAVLNCLNRLAGYLSPGDRELLNFFNGCLIYEEMLRSIVSNDDGDMENLAAWHVSPGQQISVTPHPWTGVSPDLLRLFGKTMFLCRRSRNRWRQPDTVVADKLLNETADYQEAAVIEEVLLATELPDLPFLEDAATEKAALKRHLHDAAEAYRLSSLLQLYQTFPALVARRLPAQVDAANGFVPYSGWLSPLALHVTNILRSIPPSSSMRCLHPLLCLCAGTGLRYDNVTNSLAQGQDASFGTGAMGTAASDGYGLLSGLSSGVIGENDLEIASARRFLMERLGRLEQNLPPKPIQVEKELLKSIWATYDSETGGNCTTHWLDVMVNNELESVFG